MTDCPAPRRSPAVSGAIALGISGCLLASTATPSQSHHWWLTILLLLPAIEMEVRTYRIPLWFGGLECVGACSIVFTTGGAMTGWDAVTAAILMAVALLPLLGLRIVGPGAALCAAAVGALWGTAGLPGLFLLAALFGSLFVAARLIFGANPRMLPVTPILGIAASIHLLL